MGGARAQLEAVGALALAGVGQGELAPPGYGWALVKLLGALLLVCALAYLVLVLVRRQLGAARALGASIRVIERLPLSSRQSLYLVEVAGRYLLLGAGEGGPPTRLAELEPEVVRRAEAESQAGRRRSFWQVLNREGADGGRQDDAG